MLFKKHRSKYNIRLGKGFLGMTSKVPHMKEILMLDSNKI